MTALVPHFTLGDLDLTEAPFMVEFGTNLGNPENAAEVLTSLLDGEVIVSRRSGNRMIELTVLIDDDDLDSLSDHEATLFAECEKQRSTLSFDPGDGLAAVTVFDTFRVQPHFLRDDSDEWSGFRRYVLTIPAWPFGRSESEIIDAALTVGGTPTTVTIADGTSATGWTSPDGSVTSTGGYLLIPGGLGGYEYAGGVYTWTSFADASVVLSAVDFTATPYVSFEVSQDHGWETLPYNPQAFVDGIELTHVASAIVNNGASQRHTYLCNDASASTLRIKTLVQSTSTTTTQPDSAMRIDNVTRSNQPPNPSTTVKQSLRTITVRGSARTRGSLAISAATGLGDVMIYTCPALATGYTPDLRKWLSSGDTPTTDATAVYGSSIPQPSAWWVFTAPCAQFPRGGYVLKARVSGSSSGTAKFTWTAATKVGSTTLAQQTGTTPTINITAGVWQIITLGFVTLPPTDVPAGSSGSVVIQLQKASGTAVVSLDEAWAYYAGDDACLTQVACGSGTPALGTVHNRLWLDSGENGEPMRVLVGTQADRSDAFNAGDFAVAWDEHQWPAGPLTVSVVTTGPSTLAAVDLRHYARFFTHAQRVA